MITGEINLHEEPKPVYVNNYKPAQPLTQEVLNAFGVHFTQFELNKEQTRAFNEGIRNGTKWRHKSAPCIVTIEGWNLIPGKLECIDGLPAIIRGKRETIAAPGQTMYFNYTVDEILEMEKQP